MKHAELLALVAPAGRHPLVDVEHAPPITCPDAMARWEAARGGNPALQPTPAGAARDERARTGAARDGPVTHPVCFTGETRDTFKPLATPAQIREVEQSTKAACELHGFTADALAEQHAAWLDKQAPATLVPFDAPQSVVPFFCDWMTISQVWTEGGLPEVHAGAVWKADAQGEILWKTIAAVQHTGSHETHLLIRSDGNKVTLSGNLSRFGRADNVFGFSVAECIQRANVVLAGYGLPSFSAGQRIQFINRGHIRTAWTGARISRLDLTANWIAGSADNAQAVLQWLGSQHNGRKSGRVLKAGETVDWGQGSRRQYWKAYIKYLELLARRRKGGIVDDRILEYCEFEGLIRFEGTVRSNALTDLGAAYLGDYESGWAMGQLIRLFEEHSAVMHRAQKATDDLSDLPVHLRATARDYLAGDDPGKGRSRATLWRHRQALLPYGIDIAIMNVKAFQPRVRVIELARAEVPSWYQLAA